jgi:hypothetical protein
MGYIHTFQTVKQHSSEFVRHTDKVWIGGEYYMMRVMFRKYKILSQNLFVVLVIILVNLRTWLNSLFCYSDVFVNYVFLCLSFFLCVCKYILFLERATCIVRSVYLIRKLRGKDTSCCLPVISTQVFFTENTKLISMKFGIACLK